MSEQVVGKDPIDLAEAYVLAYTDTYGDMDTGLVQARQMYDVSGPQLADRVNTILGLGQVTKSLFED